LAWADLSLRCRDRAATAQNRPFAGVCGPACRHL